MVVKEKRHLHRILHIDKIPLLLSVRVVLSIGLEQLYGLGGKDLTVGLVDY